MKKPVDKL